MQTLFAMLAEQRIDSVSTRDKDKENFVKNLTPTNYFSERITELGLTEAEAFRNALGYDKDGNILQFIRNFEGKPITFIPQFGKKRNQWNKLQNRSTSYNLDEEQFHEYFFITRYTPQYLQRNPIKGKYRFPSKNIQVWTFFQCLTILQ